MKIIDSIKKYIHVRKIAKELQNNVNNFQVRRYEAARDSYANYYWSYLNVPEDSEIYRDLSVLKARSKDAVQNDAYAKKYVNMVAMNVVGTNGFTLDVNGTDTVNSKQVLDIVGNQVVENAFYEWAKAKYCDIAGKLSFVEMCHVIMKDMPKNGESLIKIIRTKATKENPFGYQLQLLDSERLDVKAVHELSNGNRVVMGVEINKFGKPVAYWIRKIGKTTSQIIGGNGFQVDDYEVVPAKDIFHLYMQDNVEQTRGIPWMHSVLLLMKDLDTYNKATLHAAKAGAVNSIFFERDAGVKANDIADGKNDNGDLLMAMDINKMRILQPGLRMKSFNGTFPSEAYEAYTKKMLQKIATGLNVSPLFLAGDTQDVNYSNSRTILVEERNNWMRIQNWFIENFLCRLYEDWLEQALLNNAIKFYNGNTLPISKIDKFKNHKWSGFRWDWIDPAKDSDSNKTLLEAGLTSKIAILNGRGIDYEELLKEKLREKELEEKYGISFNPVENKPEKNDNINNNNNSQEENNG